jgi:hypothetical protein
MICDTKKFSIIELCLSVDILRVQSRSITSHNHSKTVHLTEVFGTKNISGIRIQTFMNFIHPIM